MDLLQFWIKSIIIMYSIINAENVKMYEPPMIVDQDLQVLQVQVHSINEFAPKYLNELQEDVILDKKVRSS